MAAEMHSHEADAPTGQHMCLIILAISSSVPPMRDVLLSGGSEDCLYQDSTANEEGTHLITCLGRLCLRSHSLWTDNSSVSVIV